MRIFKILIIGTFSAMALWACTEEKKGDEDPYDEAYYAANATVSSSDVRFTGTDDGGGYITFEAEGGQIVISVSCGTDWTAESSGSEWLDADISISAGTLTLYAGQNTSESERTAAVTLMTAASGIRIATVSVIQNVPGVTPEISAEIKQWHFPAVGDLTTEIYVTSSTEDYMVEVPYDWITVEKTGSGISIVAEPNPDYEERTCKVALTCSNDKGSAFDIISITQDGLARISLSKPMLFIGTQAGTSSMTVESNFEWNYTYDSADSWFSVSRDGDMLTASADANESGDARIGSVLITAGDGAENVTELSFEVRQSGSSTLILEYTVSAGTQIQLPLDGTVSCAVIWGDDSAAETVSSSAPSHKYAAAGTYDVRIDGTVTALSSENTGSSSSCLVGIVQWGRTGLESMEHAFYNCSSLSSIPDDSYGAFSSVTTFGYAFYGCTALKALPSGLFSYCSAVTEFKYAFAGCTSLSTLPSGLFSGCTAASSFYNTFIYCTSLSSVGDGLFDSCTAAKSFYGVFDACTSLTSVPSGLFAKCTEATDFSYVLYYTGLNEIPTGLFDNNTKATTFIGAFAYCPNIKSVPAGLFAKCPEVTDYYGVFYCCTALETVGEGVFDNCVSAETFDFAFYYCPKLKTLPENLFAYATKVTKMTHLFYECTSLASLPKGLFAGCTAVTSMQSVFYKCALESLPEDLFANCTAVTSFMETFYMCQSLTSVPSGLFDACTLATRFDYTFYGCTALTTIPPGLFSKCPNVRNFSQTFYFCTSLASLPYDLFENCLNVSSFSNTFYNCSSLTGESPYNLIDGKKVHLYERGDDAYSDIFGTIILTSGCFYNCEGLSDYDSMPDTWKQLHINYIKH